MNARDAMNAALDALRKIDEAVEDHSADPEDVLDDVRDIVGDAIGELARAGYTAGAA